ncbi:HNH endonuclease signature motif containing protein [Mycobacterium sp. 141]|uniref:HNH endonuclease signature motif containing protein n=1 Tax=Mycobacterium sp. 141 TaxID=1120797 RepID=UPI00037004C7|nr:HNH endonuclease signature motif containing protein [Mycobacterium sp. 141]
MEGSVAAKLAALRAAITEVRDLPWGSLSTADLLDVCSGIQNARNLLPTVEHAAITALSDQSTPAKIGAKSWPEVLRIRLRISQKEARRRYRDAITLGPRTTLTGQPMPPLREATAAAQAGGWLTPDHIEELEKFFTECPAWVDTERRQKFEEKLVAVAAADCPDVLRQAVAEALYLLNQDGDEPVEDLAAHQRSIVLGPQQPDGTRTIRGRMTPELGATLGAVIGKWGAPGMCNPDDQTPCVSGTPTQEQIDTDTRTSSQRTHDALLTLGRHALMSGELGQHNGLPVSIVITTTLHELEAGAGVAVTTTGSKLPISDVIRLAAHAHHYLAVFDKHTNVPLYLGRSKRIASPGQRLVLFARDRGCTRPGCTASGDRCQAHHANQDFAQGGLTNITDLALGCGPHQRLVGPGKWTTRINTHGRCEWIPPALLDTGQSRINTYHLLHRRQR